MFLFGNEKSGNDTQGEIICDSLEGQYFFPQSSGMFLPQLLHALIDQRDFVLPEFVDAIRNRCLLQVRMLRFDIFDLYVLNGIFIWLCIHLHSLGQDPLPSITAQVDDDSSCGVS